MTDPAPQLITGPRRLVAASALMLFVELALIRWTGEHVLYLSYFSNFVLLGSFLGIGLGFLRSRPDRQLLQYAPFALLGLVAFVAVFPVSIDRPLGDLAFHGQDASFGIPIWVSLPVIFSMSALVMALITDGVAQSFRQFDPLQAYRLDIGGSVLGVLAFSALSFVHASPIVWGALAAVGLWALLAPATGRRVTIALVGLVAILGVQSLASGDLWSPYYRISVVEGPGTLQTLSVNGIPHQAVGSLADRTDVDAIYEKPYELSDTALENVLIVGAGSGTDVAIALERGAEHIDAVEIDPVLAELGFELNLDQPYSDPRVSLHIGDGRAFLEQTDQRYDLIVFALPDSLTLVSGQSALRLESYLFTSEAFAEARDHLADGGAFAMYNYYPETWLVDRLTLTLDRIFGAPPCIDRVSDDGALAVLVAGSTTGCERLPVPLSAPAPATDNYPFVYLREPGIPGLYLVVLSAILVISGVAVRRSVGTFSTMRPYADLFFMGVAFLLLETMYVVQFALLFGTTWFVNAFVFVGILLAVYLAVEVARRIRLPRPHVLYLALAASLIVSFTVPQAALLGLAGPVRFVAAITLAFAPVFIANLVFAQRFKDTASSTVAFGANLLGAMVGGVLEYLALITGYRALVIVVAVLYAAAFVLGRRYVPVAAST